MPGGDFDPSAMFGGGFDASAMPGGGFDASGMPGGGFDASAMPGGGFDASAMSGGGFDPSAMFGGGFDASAMPGGGFDPSSMFGGGFDLSAMSGEGFTPPSMPDGFDGMPDMGGVGDSDVKLQYTDDNPESYPNIWNGAKTDITSADQQRLIASLKKLSEGQSLETVVDMNAVIRYLVVHNFMCNDDSYTGMMVHNYYLYEEDGQLSVIPWDYNLALGGFSMGGMFGSSGATSTVNSPIDSPVSGGSIASRPMISWIFSDEQYTKQYHDVYAEFMETVFDSGWFESHMRSVIEMISPYVQRDKNGFFSYDEFVKGSDTLLEFSSLRAQSVAGQLDGSVPSTTEGQRADSSALIDASHLALSDMGEFGMGGGGGFPGMPGEGGFDMPGNAGASRSGGKRGERNSAPEPGTDQTHSDENGRNQFDFDRSKMPDSFGGMPGGVMPAAAGASSAIFMVALSIACLLVALICVKRWKPHQ
ncbi:MAG: CotH kinase family protein [Clostridia bacterium]|nr:CotH kinase family protein [Clostridia bacterium]